MRLFGGDRVSSLMDTLKLDEDTPIENRMITSTLESAQKKLEGRNFEIRKNVLKYDDVMNQQREIIYASAARCWTVRISAPRCTTCCGRTLIPAASSSWPEM